ncbi:hypothetical protein B0T20DRAFT_92030 [Sordaria brevicollis]|uniref:Uncharacterized protein n=1 Tax=Sordaria brevicollis TaxID=83679 RepID=A0AAE0NX19_SORBR|nr:hypothetical protein B0T20DRAFT_92030 [Sordaria brevicollis]
MMDMVYTNGVLNLGAILGEESHGLEYLRNPLSIMPCVVTPAPNVWHGVGEVNHSFLNVQDDFDFVIPSAPLYKRGWTLQERSLSTRTFAVSSFIGNA